MPSTRRARRRLESPADALARLVGQHLRALRERRGWRQADVAGRARAQGLPWLNATVPLVEQGKRRVALDELLVLPTVYDVPSDEILPREEIEIWKMARVYLARDLALAQWTDREDQIWLREVGHKPDYPKVVGEDEARQPVLDPAPRRDPLPELIDLIAGGEAEIDAADALKLHPHHIALRAWKLWKAGRWQIGSLTGERDARMRVAEQQDARLQDPNVSEEEKRKRRGAIRGHLSRVLLSDIKNPTIAGKTRSRKRGTR
jgi:transcriptional regulator with XRE-family HTH domain